jgi:hypothetical protein
MRNRQETNVVLGSLSAAPSDESTGDLTARGAGWYSSWRPPVLAVHEEAVVVDERSGVRPAQMVENKLTSMLRKASLPVSHLRMPGLLRSR